MLQFSEQDNGKTFAQSQHDPFKLIEHAIANAAGQRQDGTPLDPVLAPLPRCYAMVVKFGPTPQPRYFMTPTGHKRSRSTLYDSFDTYTLLTLCDIYLISV